jgi:hypothetical protein
MLLGLEITWRRVSALSPGRFTSEEIAKVNHWIGGWVGPRVSVDDMEK